MRHWRQRLPLLRIMDWHPVAVQPRVQDQRLARASMLIPQGLGTVVFLRGHMGRKKTP